MSQQKKIAVVLSGCGVMDGSEIHESVMTLWAIQKHGAEALCFAPNIMQHHVINHLTSQPEGDARNVLVEAARIARGKITDLAKFDASQVDALILPGGFGAAKNLCSFAFDGPACTVNPDVERAVRAMVKAGKPIGALCIAPVILAKLLGQVELTIGKDPDTAAALQAMGATHKATTHGEVAIDHRLKIVTTPCYMLDANLPQIADGAENVIKAILKMID